MTMAGNAFRGLYRSLVPSLFVVTCVMSGVQPAFSHDAVATPAASTPEVFKTAPAGTPTDRPGRNLQFLCIPGLTALNNGVAPVYTESTNSWVHCLDIVVSEIPYVKGNVRWRNHRFKEIRRLYTRRFVGNNLPNHVTGEFPVKEGTAAYPYYKAAPGSPPYETADQIPIAAYNLDITVPRSPSYNVVPTCIDQLTSGVATQTGIVWHVNIANGSSTTYGDLLALLPNDTCFGHPYNYPGTPNGQYHYHGWSWKCFPNQGNPKSIHRSLDMLLMASGSMDHEGKAEKLLPMTNLTSATAILAWSTGKVVRGTCITIT